MVIKRLLKIIVGMTSLMLMLSNSTAALAESNPAIEWPGASNAITEDDPPCFTVRGRVTRLEKTPTIDGYVESRVPVHDAVVEIREDDQFFGLFDDSYATVTTNQNGEFNSGLFCTFDDWLGLDNVLELYVRLWGGLWSRSMYVVQVQNRSWFTEVYRYDSSKRDSTGGDVTVNFYLSEDQSSVFNIADAVFDAWDYWNDSGGTWGGDSYFKDTTVVHWEDGYIDSFYDEFWNKINIGDRNTWEDSDIIFYWAMFATDMYSCGAVTTLSLPFYAFTDSGSPVYDDMSLYFGYAIYYQSAVRTVNGNPYGSYYINQETDFYFNLENGDFSDDVYKLSGIYKVAMALWDFIDDFEDGQDKAQLEHDDIQDVYTSNSFQNVAEILGCNIEAYMVAWVNLWKPTNAETAAILEQNTGSTYLEYNSALPKSSLEGKIHQIIPVEEVSSEAIGPGEHIWWDQVTYVVDNSDSMAGDKFEATKDVIQETAYSLGALPGGSELALETFDNAESENELHFAGQFFPENLTGIVADLDTSDPPDNSCLVEAFKALAQAVEDQAGGDAWLFTDGDTELEDYSVEVMKQILNEHQVKASMVLMGLCPAQTQDPVDKVQRTMLQGAAQAYLGPAADNTPGGVVPYLLTALNSGGKFLYVDQDQLVNATDILQAQITHSAGAGAWSDYVSDHATYRYDELASWEYNWIDADPFHGGTDHGIVKVDGYLDIDLPEPFIYYQQETYTEAHAHENGVITLGPYFGAGPINLVIPNVGNPNNAVYPFWDNLWSVYADEPVQYGFIYSKPEGDWFAIQYNRFSTDQNLSSPNTFEVLFNMDNGEIRFQYDGMSSDGSGATIGLENHDGTVATQVSYNQPKVSNDMGFKFEPAPPQPSKTYTVTVDALMEGVGFLLTGYSGSFEPLVISDPDGKFIDCGEQGALCIDLGLVQYVQVNVDGRVGDWHAVVDAGSTGEGTFSFNSMAASAIEVQSSGDHSLPAGEGSPIIVNLDQAVDGDVLTGWFVKPADSAFGGAFNLFDDGKHGDGAAGDGKFATDLYNPPGAGTVYLWVEGAIDGEGFKRNDPVPYTFQPVQIRSLGDGVNYGADTELDFEITNQDEYDHCYYLTGQVPQGWQLNFSGLGDPPQICLGAGQTSEVTVYVYMDPRFPNNLPSGTSGEVYLSVTEQEKGIMSNAASARVTRHREAAEIRISQPGHYIRPYGDTVRLDFVVIDEQGVYVADGTEVSLSASLGTISPVVATTNRGRFQATFTSGRRPGIAEVEASTETRGGTISATTTIEIAYPKPNQIELELSTSQLPPDGVSTAELVATVTDPWGNPAAGERVQIGVEGDGRMGSIEGGEIISGTTDINGQFTAILTAGMYYGETGIRAELLILEDGSYRVIHEDRKVLRLIYEIFLPLIYMD